ncbi:unnamed protein product [Periconia digitata]|uniref:BTB domain-containing protein n=1 Tax=Periconia digitata TaxID=1303443 RepID=A0A9W4U299_9PLEO|nr:unnamed protein product [Periconia digitata]
MAKKKSKKLDHKWSASELGTLAMNQQIKTSPYTIGPVILRIGPKKREFYIPECLLENTNLTFSQPSCLDRGVVNLPDVDESTGHVLVHYLYTGVYQTLEDADSSPEKQSKIGFHRAFLTFAAAVAYNLPGLQQLAMREIRDFGTEMSIFDIIATVDKDFSKLPSGKHQVYEYISEKASSTFEQNLSKLSINIFLEDVSNVDLAKLLVQCTVDLYNRKTLETSNTATGPLQMDPERSVKGTEEEIRIGEPQIAEDTPSRGPDTQKIAADTPAPESASIEPEQPTIGSSTKNTRQICGQTNWWDYAPWKSVDAKEALPVIALQEDCGICRKCMKKARKKKKKEERGKNQAIEEDAPPKMQEEKITKTTEDTEKASSLRSASVDEEGYEVLH